MANIEETRLPGVGVRQDFVTKDGQRIGVIVHRSGLRDLLVYDDEDPDAVAATVRLEEEDSHALAELLGAPTLTESLTEDLQQSVEGLTIDWVPVRATSKCAGGTIADTQLRRRTGVTIVAIIRDGETIPSPTPETELRAGDTAVVVGTPEGIQQAVDLLRG